MMYGVNIFLQSLECAPLTFFMKLLSDIITPVPLCIIAVIIYWSVNKRTGIITALTIIFSVAVNTPLKLLFKIPRPHEVNPLIKKLDTTGGYSFPSGHSQQASGMGTVIFLARGKKRGALLAMAVFTVLIMVSRMYLGMHSAADVLCGALLGILSALFCSALYGYYERTKKTYVLFSITLFALIFTVLTGFDRDMAVMSAISFGAICGLIIDEKFIGYKVPCGIFKKIAASVTGLIVILLVKALFMPFDTKNLYVAFLEYSLFGLTITAGAPYIIKKVIYRKDTKA